MDPNATLAMIRQAVELYLNHIDNGEDTIDCDGDFQEFIIAVESLDE